MGMLLPRDFFELAQNAERVVIRGYQCSSRKRMNGPSLLQTTQTALSLCRSLNCWTAAITRKHRRIYKLTYPTYLIQPDGSSIQIHYDTPRRIITLPLNIETLSEVDRQKKIAARTPITKVKIIDEIEDDFDESKYFKIRNKQ
ncbi:mitochondrial ribosomal protein L55 [Calliopsis andreniformis]|uniref:mitochondrial ribosomal protein L55 n=1 Tax=Calliopsis andreniformis TaxID=337506 RepID=UPI003FCDAEAF